MNIVEKNFFFLMFFEDFIYLGESRREKESESTSGGRGRGRGRNRLSTEQGAPCGAQSQDPEIMT